VAALGVVAAFFAGAAFVAAVVAGSVVAFTVVFLVVAVVVFTVAFFAVAAVFFAVAVVFLAAVCLAAGGLAADGCLGAAPVAFRAPAADFVAVARGEDVSEVFATVVPFVAVAAFAATVLTARFGAEVVFAAVFFAATLLLLPPARSAMASPTCKTGAWLTPRTPVGWQEYGTCGRSTNMPRICLAISDPDAAGRCSYEIGKTDDIT
jgi:hypothetical protein